MTEVSRFTALVGRMAEDNGWIVSELSEEEAVLEYKLEGDKVCSLYLSMDEDEVVEIAVPSEAVFASEDEIPHEASTALLKRNLQTSAGFWVLDQYEDELSYTLVHVELLETLEESDREELAELISALVEECEEFNGLWEEEDY